MINMEDNNMLGYLESVLENRPADWLNLTTHRLDIYNEKLAKTQFLEHFEALYKDDNAESSALSILPTAFDYIRLGHPLSCVLEWAIAKINNSKAENVISFSSTMAPVLAVLRKNSLERRNTQIVYKNNLSNFFDVKTLKEVYAYEFDLKKIQHFDELPAFEGSTIYISMEDEIQAIDPSPNVDFYIHIYGALGSVILVNGANNEAYISEIQHVRRRETIAMTPANCLLALKTLIGKSSFDANESKLDSNKAIVLNTIQGITGSPTTALVGSSGLSIQYAIMMGLIHDAFEKHPGKAVKFIVPPNCYGGTNDQARRVAACIDQVEVVDLPVDGGQDMVQSIDTVLNELALEDAIPYIIAEIPTNPRVEVPDLIKLQAVLTKQRKTNKGVIAVDPVFILDQTFCPNVHFLGEGEILSPIRSISYSSGSKFPSGGLCTAGYCVGNEKSASLLEKVKIHLSLCDNEATDQQYEILAKQLPSMNQRIQQAYTNTREFVNFIGEVLPTAKINFVSEALAKEGFTPSVFSLDLPTKGNTDEEKEAYKRALNLKLINLMIQEIPDESKYCVSYGQLKGCYWTIPATSTQGTTKEGDKDYIIRAALSPKMDVDLHKKVFLNFVEKI
ncbi:MAG: hypothetical protein Sapg2KO_07120 [Saprospiraceae bacterium]